MTPQELSGELSLLITPFISMMVGIIIALWIKDYAVGIARGLSFKLFGPFIEGDKAILDGKQCIVVKIGLTMTVFGIYEGDDYIWRYVPNEKISSLKLGKVIISDNKL